MKNLSRFPVPTRFSEEEDFTGAFFKVQTVTSGGAGAGGSLFTSIYPDKNVCGVLGLSTGTTATASVRVYTNPNCLEFNGGEIIFCTRVNFPALFTTLQDGLFRIGFGNILTATTADQDHANGAYFEYNRSLSPNWRTCTASSSVRTKNTSSIPVNLNWNTLCIVINKDATSVGFFINGVLINTITTNIPRLFNLSYNFYLKKTVGTTAFVVNNDYYIIQKQFNKAR